MHSFLATLARWLLFFALSVLGALLPTNPVSNLPGWGSPQVAAAAVYCPSDVDANGVSDALTDRLLIIRYQFCFQGEVLIDGAVDPNCTRCTAEEISVYCATLVP